MKFEFQTRNYVYAIPISGTPTVTKLPRKFGEKSPGFEESSVNEAGGDQASFLATGKHGGAKHGAKKQFVRPQAPEPYEIEEDTKADASLPAQFVLTYLVKVPVTAGAVPTAGQVRLLGEINHALDPAAAGKYNPNTFENEYRDKDDNILDIHIDGNGKFQPGKEPLLKVSKQDKWTEKTGDVTITVDLSLPAQFIQEYQSKTPVTESDLVGLPFKESSFTKKRIRSNVTEMHLSSGQYNAGMYDIQYLDDAGKLLKVHVAKDNTFQKGRVELLRKQSIPAAEQSAVELQVEHGSVIEFETPKWFDDWDELKMRIEDAVQMTADISDPSRKITDAAVLTALNATEGQLFDWPYDTSHLPLLKDQKLKLVAYVPDPTWTAKIQKSESISLSEFESVLSQSYTESSFSAIYWKAYHSYLSAHPGKEEDAKAHAHTEITANEAAHKKSFEGKVKALVNLVKLPAIKIFTEAFDGPTLTNKPDNADLLELYKTHFADLVGFLELILHYIYQGQTTEMYSSTPEDPNKEYDPKDDKATYSKGAINMMARTSFGSMYTNLLNDDEKKLFQAIVNDASDPMLAEIQPAIDTQRAAIKTARSAELKKETDKRDKETNPVKLKNIKEKLKRKYWNTARWDTKTLTRTSTLFFDKVGTDKVFGPVIYQWLFNMISGKDLMTSAKTPGLSASHGIRKVSTDTKDKDYKKAQFEVRAGPSLPASEWVNFARRVFDAGRERGGDTPDLQTTSKNEAARTALRK
jgi:hypothetical protein